MELNLNGKTVLVTGGSRGIGKAIVLKLAKENANVAFTYNSSKEKADQVKNEAQNLGAGNIRCYQANVTDPLQADLLIEQIEEEVGEVYGLVNNAGITKDTPFFKMSADDWNSVIDTNLNGAFHMTKSLVGKMIRRDGGKIVNMSSVSGIRGSVGQANYSATKAGLISLTQTLAKEFARFNVQVNAVAPGFIATEMVEQMQDKAKKQINSMVPSKRMGEPEEVADATMFLLSQASDYINGHTLVIDGALTA